MRRTLAWNVALLLLEVGLAGWGHVVAGLAWMTIALELAGVAAFGVTLMTYVIRVHVPWTLRRHQGLLQAHLTASRVAEGRRHEVVDSQSTPHKAAPSFTAGASRAR